MTLHKQACNIFIAEKKNVFFLLYPLSLQCVQMSVKNHFIKHNFVAPKIVVIPKIFAESEENDLGFKFIRRTIYILKVPLQK